KTRPARTSSMNHSATPFFITHSSRSLLHSTRYGSTLAFPAAWSLCSVSITSALSPATEGRACTRSMHAVTIRCRDGLIGERRHCGAGVHVGEVGPVPLAVRRAHALEGGALLIERDAHLPRLGTEHVVVERQHAPAVPPAAR